MSRAMLHRDTELAALGERLGRVRAGSGRVILVEGPAGIGKSSLLSAAGRDAGAAGMRVLRAWGGPLEHDAGWGIARQLFAPLRVTPDWAELTVGAAGLARRALDAEPGEPPPAADAMHATAHGLTWLASGLAERRPTVLVVDDAHWADVPSLRWLVQLVPRLPELPLGVLLAVRAGEPPASPGLLAELVAAAPEPPVRPRPLPPDAVAAVVRARLPGAGDGFVQGCHAATAGNPFLLGALLDQLRADEVETTDDVGAGLAAFGPEQVARSVDRQLSRLPDGAGAFARALAVLGRGAALRHARVLAGLGPDDATRLADLLRGAGLVDSDDHGYTLVHPLVAGAMLRGLPVGERADWHRRAALLLDGEGAAPEAVALHLLHSEPAREPAAVAVLRAAAREAGRRGAPETAAVLLRRALAEPPPDRGVEAEVRSELGLALAAHVRPEAPQLLTTAVELAADPAQRARIALSGGRALGLAGYFAEAVRLCRLGLEATDDGSDPALTGRLEAELMCGGWLQAATVDGTRERLRRGAGQRQPAALRDIHAAWQSVCDARPVEEARALLARALAVGTPAEDADSLAGTTAIFALIACDELDLARAQCDEVVDAARPRGWLIALAHGSFLRAMALTRAGRIRDAVIDARLAFDFKVLNSPPSATAWGLVPLVEALTELDEPDDAEAALGAAARLGDPPPGLLTGPMLHQARGRLLLARHRPADAYAELRAAADGWDALRIRHPGLASWRVDAAEALVALDDVPGARTLALAHLELADGVGLPGPRGAGLRALARTAGGEEAVQLLGEAVEGLDGTSAQLELARALVDLGAALRRVNRRAAAREPLRRALDLAERGGMRLLGRRARHELAATGARPRRGVLSGVAALTPAEHRVALLAAEGHSNREIAQLLYVTRRTVETHLTHAFHKLGATHRDQLAGRLDIA